MSIVSQYTTSNVNEDILMCDGIVSDISLTDGPAVELEPSAIVLPQYSNNSCAELVEVCFGMV